jgi:DNA polymerase epsilon subunit 4
MEGPAIEETNGNEENLNIHDISAEYNHEQNFEEVNDTEAEAEALAEAEAETEVPQDEEPKIKLTKLPIGRIRTIIKTDPDLNLINQEAVFLITKATVRFN